MVTPEIDVPGKPFSYIAHPTDQMGWLFNHCGTEITPEGYLYTGYGELLFFVGQNQSPVKQRLRTLYKDYLPIYQYEVEEDGLVYAFQMFASPANENEPTSNLINFIRVRVTNPPARPRVGAISAWPCATATKMAGTVTSGPPATGRSGRTGMTANLSIPTGLTRLKVMSYTATAI
ncbi:MAG: hypothetical protein Q9P14_04640 [candidate division KSB1 bacterium]|nr:hypothetical protein [candidate division KSB1 bacterium]